MRVGMHQEVEKELTPKEQYTEGLNSSIRNYRSAVRWLREARIYSATFASEDWKGTEEAEIGKDSKKAYSEAISGVLYWRREVDKYNRLLIDLAKKQKDKDGR